MDQLREGIGLRAYGQKNPLIDYYRSVVLNKLSKNFEAEKLKKLSEFNLSRSDYWQKRFSTLDININKMN